MTQSEHKRTKEVVKEQREDITKLAKRKHTFNKGDRRVHSPRVCVICSRPLSSLIIQEGKYVTATRHTRFHINEMFIVDTCTSINSCYRHLRIRGELEDENG